MAISIETVDGFTGFSGVGDAHYLTFDGGPAVIRITDATKLRQPGWVLRITFDADGATPVAVTSNESSKILAITIGQYPGCSVDRLRLALGTHAWHLTTPSNGAVALATDNNVDNTFGIAPDALLNFSGEASGSPAFITTTDGFSGKLLETPFPTPFSGTFAWDDPGDAKNGWALKIFCSQLAGTTQARLNEVPTGVLTWGAEANTISIFLRGTGPFSCPTVNDINAVINPLGLTMSTSVPGTTQFYGNADHTVITLGTFGGGVVGDDLVPAPYWGPHAPDFAGPSFSIPAVQALLPLADPLTVSGALENVTIRARQAGIPGNLLRVEFVAGSLAEAGEVLVSGNDITVRWNDGDRVGDVINTINTTSDLIEVIGTYNPSDVLIETEDEFAFTELEGGVDAQVNLRCAYWGPHYPDAKFSQSVANFIPGTGPAGVGTLALELEDLTVSMEYRTGVFRARSGYERRLSVYDDCLQKFSGKAHLIGEDALTVRDLIGQYVALGSVFQLALPHEELTIVEDSPGRTVTVPTTFYADWCNLGQRVVVIGQNGQSVKAVIQGFSTPVDPASSSATATIELDTTLGDIGDAGARIMPTVAVYLDAKQGFSRHPIARDGTHADVEQVETWAIEATAIGPLYRAGVIPPRLLLEDVTASSGPLGSVVWQSYFASGAVFASLDEDAGVDHLEVNVSDFGANTYIIEVLVEASGVVTLAELAAAITATGVMQMIGDYDPDDVISSSEYFALAPFSTPVADPSTGEETPAEVGRGVTSTLQTISTPERQPEYYLVWDRDIDLDDVAPDSMHAGSTIDVIDALPFAVGKSTRADWGRSLMLRRSTMIDWQWIKAFLDRVVGGHHSFLLPTFREDLIAAAPGPSGVFTIVGDLIVDASYGNFELWSLDHKFLRIDQGGEVYFAKVQSSTLNDDGTRTIAIERTDGIDLPPAADVLMISWCEIVRFEDDVFEFSWSDGATFSTSTRARVIRQVIDVAEGD